MVKNLLDLLRRHKRWKPREAPAADRWHALGQGIRDMTSQMKIAEKGPQTAAHRLAAVRGTIESMALDISDDELRVESREHTWFGWKYLLQE